MPLQRTVKMRLRGILTVFFPVTTLGNTVEPRIVKFNELLTGTVASGTTSCASPISPLKICIVASCVAVAIFAEVNKWPIFTRNIFVSSRGSIATSL